MKNKMMNINRNLESTTKLININKYKVLYLIYLVALKYLKNPIGLFFSFFFPIIWIIIAYFIWGSGSYDNHVGYILQYTGFSLIPVASLGIMSLPIVFAVDRIYNITKIYSILNISQIKYIMINYLIILIQLLIVINIVLLLGNFLFIGDIAKAHSLLISANVYFAILFSDIFIFSSCFFLSLLFSLFGSKVASIFSLLLTYYYISIFVSGTFIPSFIYIKEGEYNWLKWLQYLTPIGCGGRIINIITLNLDKTFAYEHLFNQLKITWNSDWLMLISPILQGALGFFMFVKLSVWRGKKNLNTINYHC